MTQHADNGNKGTVLETQEESAFERWRTIEVDAKPDGKSKEAG